MSKKGLLAWAMLAGFGVAQAGELTLSPLIGDHDFSNATSADGTKPAQGVKNGREYMIDLGYRFTPNWSVEASTGKSTTHEKSPFYSDKLHYRQEDLNVMYRFLAGEPVQPFVLLGGGRADYLADHASPFAKGYGQGGAGVVWNLFPHVGLRSEVRYIDMPGPHWHDWLGLIGLEFSVGSFPTAAAAVVPAVAAVPTPVAAPAPAPAPVAAPADDDHDGVPNDLDKCPNTPAGVKVDAQGCPLDSDHDGVPDYLDKCPNTPAGVVVDQQGCPVMLSKTQVMSLDVKFATGSDKILGDPTTELGKVVDFMKAYPNQNITIDGYTDNRGKKAMNLRLSQRRADAVRRHLVDMGVNAARLKAVGHGEADPIASNSSAAGRAANRRVVATAKAETRVEEMKK